MTEPSRGNHESCRPYFKEEIGAVLAAPDERTAAGRRDMLLFEVAYLTGARVSELADMRVEDFTECREVAILIRGKGLKQRALPLVPALRKKLKVWIERGNLQGTSPSSPTLMAAGSPVPASREG